MEEIPPTPPLPHVAGVRPVPHALGVGCKQERWYLPRVVVIGLTTIVFAYGCYESARPYGRIVEGVRHKEAQVMGVSLSNATQQFLTDYGKLPLPVSGVPATGDLDTDSGGLSGLVTVLLGKEPPGSKLQNPRAINYLDGIKPAKPNKKPAALPWINGLTWDPALSQFSVVDAWGSLYRVRLDTNGDGFVENPSPDEVAEGRPQLKQRVIVWSPGKDGHEETWSDNPKSWD